MKWAVASRVREQPTGFDCERLHSSCAWIFIGRCTFRLSASLWIIIRSNLVFSATKVDHSCTAGRVRWKCAGGKRRRKRNPKRSLDRFLWVVYGRLALCFVTSVVPLVITKVCDNACKWNLHIILRRARSKTHLCIRKVLVWRHSHLELHFVRGEYFAHIYRTLMNIQSAHTLCW